MPYRKITGRRALQLNLSRGIIVSECDRDLIFNDLWYIASQKTQVCRTFRDPLNHSFILLLHRVVMERIKGRVLQYNEKIIHLDDDPLNCCRENLQLVDQSYLNKIRYQKKSKIVPITERSRKEKNQKPKRWVDT